MIFLIIVMKDNQDKTGHMDAIWGRKVLGLESAKVWWTIGLLMHDTIINSLICKKGLQFSISFVGK